MKPSTLPCIGSVRSEGAVLWMPLRTGYACMVRSIGWIPPGLGAWSPEECNQAFAFSQLNGGGVPVWYSRLRPVLGKRRQHPVECPSVLFRADVRTAPLLRWTCSGRTTGIHACEAEEVPGRQGVSAPRSRDRRAIASTVGVAFQAAEPLEEVGGEGLGKRLDGAVEVLMDPRPSVPPAQPLRLEVSRFEPQRGVLVEAGKVPGKPKPRRYWPGNAILEHHRTSRVHNLENFGWVEARGYYLLYACGRFSDLSVDGQCASSPEGPQRRSPPETVTLRVLRAARELGGPSPATTGGPITIGLYRVRARRFSRGRSVGSMGRIGNDLFEGAQQGPLGSRLFPQRAGERHG